MKKKVKSTLFVVLTLALISASAAVATWAAATKTASFDTDNTFTNNPNIKVRLAEPLWDAQDYTGTGDGKEDGALGDGNTKYIIGPTSVTTSGSKYVSDPTLSENQEVTPDNLGRHKAGHYASGNTIPKNPSLKNTSEDDEDKARNDTDSDSKNGKVSRDEWVAMGVEYQIKLSSPIYYMDTNQTAGADGTASKRYKVVKTTNAYILGKDLTYDTQTNFGTALASIQSKTGRIVASTPNTEAETWTDISGSKGTLYMYNKKLTKGGNTNTLFDSVLINTFTTTPEKIYAVDGDGKELILYRIDLNGASYNNNGTLEDAQKGVKYISYNSENAAERYVYVDTLPEFHINLSGNAVQGDALTIADDADTIKTELKALAGIS